MSPGFSGSTKFQKEHTARGFAIGIALERRQRCQASGWSIGVADGDGASQPGDRRGIALEQVVVGHHDTPPVRPGRTRRHRMQGGDLGAQMPHRQLPTTDRAFEMGETQGNQSAVPLAARLVLQELRHAVGTHARRQARCRQRQKSRQGIACRS